MEEQYISYKNAIAEKNLPVACIDYEKWEANIHFNVTRSKGKQIRIASKSVRSIEMIKDILSRGAPFQGIMSYDGMETVFLSQNGFDDILMGYPCTVKPAVFAVGEEIRKGKTIYFMVDSEYHLKMIQEAAENLGIIIPVCVDLDMSSDFPGLHFGVWRSSIRNIADFKHFIDKSKKYNRIRIAGLMGYEAQNAGVPDAVPGERMKNALIKFLKKRSQKEYSLFRKNASEYCRSQGIALDFVNGGGTGCIETTCEEGWVTEVTVGSGFYAPAVFDHYSDFSYQPAAFFALPIARIPKKGIYTCSGGGYIASGSTGKNKNPKVFLPKGGSLTDLEGAGEVMTPVIFSGEVNLQEGDPVFFRHAKAGELCERFNELHLIQSGKIIKTVLTYRGEGQSFL
ncbi:MAG: amino acid deaminase/aldolase [Bacteroidia bacterium]|nr:amino acid deaminase/aldolase [Bacteroidia bacterium]